MDNEIFMSRCIELARLGQGHVSSNPMVGAVLVHNGKIIGEGYHQQYGGPHAEVNCISSVPKDKRNLIEKSTMYVSLEPCSHYGKTPPCANLIVEKRIPKVVIGTKDINKKVSGRGIGILRDAGIEVEMSTLEKECHFLNRRFFTYHQQGRPYIILKWAQTMNGVMGSKKERLIISNEYTNILVHQWRSREQAILVGHQTSVSDNPLLTNRYGTGNQPLRIVLCGEDIPSNLKMFEQPGETLIFNTKEEKQNGNVIYKKVNEKKYLSEVLSCLYERGILSVIAEGGRDTLARFLNSGLWDECRIITNTEMILDGEIESPKVSTMNCIVERRIDSDLIQCYANPQNPFAGGNGKPFNFDFL